jgi:hypothetical protein
MHFHDRMKRSLNVWICTSFALLLTSAAILFHSERVLHRNRHVVVQVPLLSGEQYSAPRPFTVDVHGSYVVGFTVRKEPPPFDIRHPIPPDDCSIEFRIRSNGGIITEGNNESEGQGAGFGHHTIYRSIGRFDATPGTKYDFSFRVSQAAPGMTFDGATFSISPDPIRQKDVSARMLPWRYLGVVLGVLAIGVAILAVASKCRSVSGVIAQGCDHA